jgi:hypothetical protein
MTVGTEAKEEVLECRPGGHEVIGEETPPSPNLWDEATRRTKTRKRGR